MFGRACPLTAVTGTGFVTGVGVGAGVGAGAGAGAGSGGGVRFLIFNIINVNCFYCFSHLNPSIT